MIELYLQDFYFAEGSSPIAALPWGHWLQTWMDKTDLTIPVATEYEMTLRFTDDHEIQALNAQYRQKNQPTDVLAFATLEAQSPVNPDFLESEPLYLGDVIISVETATKQAQELQHSLVYELAWLFSHGFLHLLGWDHPDEPSLKAMLAKQDQFLQSLGLLPTTNQLL